MKLHSLISKLAGLKNWPKPSLSLVNRSDMEEKTTEIVMYGTSWCGGTRRARLIFDQNHINYRWVDIDKDADARHFVEETNHGYHSVPTIIFPDGAILVEPSELELSKKLGLT
jgi:mycoredoxin